MNSGFSSSRLIAAVVATVAALAIELVYAEPMAGPNCASRVGSKAECFSCYLTWNQQVNRNCLQRYATNVGRDTDFEGGASPEFLNCLQLSGYRKESTIEAVCMNWQPPSRVMIDEDGADAAGVTEALPDQVPIPGEKPKVSVRPQPRPKSTDPKSSQPKNGGNSDQAGNSGQSEVTGDPGQCEALKRSAVSCCSNPDSCLTSAERDEVSAAMTQVSLASQQAQQQQGNALNSLGSTSSSSNAAASNANAIYARACFRAKSSCVDTCKAASQQNSQAAGNLNTCNRLSASTFATQSTNLAGNSGQAAGAAQQAQAQSAADPYSQNPMMGGNPADPYGCMQNPTSPACVQCVQNPNNPGCQALSQANALARGEGGFSSYQGGKDSKFNLADNADAYVPEPAFGGEGGTPPTVGTVANNAGGGIPGSGGGTQPASLGAAKKSGGQAAGNSSLTDLEQGFRSGGYSQPVGGAEGDGSGQGGGGGGFGGGRGLASEESGTIDLKAYLPGGQLDPNARLGGMRPFGNQIHGKFVDIWNRISDRMREKCRAGKLTGCS